MHPNKSTKLKESSLVLLSKLSEEEKQTVHKWASSLLAIVKNSDLTRIQKMNQLRLQKVPIQIAPLLKGLVLLAKDKLWLNQSWARRGMAVGLGVGALAFGSKAAGLATAGLGVAVPIVLITSVGATFLGVIVDEIEKEKRK